MEKTYAYLATLIGILLILPLVGVDALGTVMDGTAAWIISIAILIIGLMGIFKK